MRILPVSAPAPDIAGSLARHYGPAPKAGYQVPPVIDRRKTPRGAPQAADPMGITAAGVQELISRLAA